MKSSQPASRAAAIALLATLLLAGCVSLQPVENRPAEYTHPPAQAALWQSIETIRRDDWQLPLNAGTEALDWRLRAIDSAVDSIDLQTFLWSLDTVGALMLDHLVRAADRGVRVRILVDDSFLSGEDGLVMALHEHPDIEYRIFNPFKRRAGGIVTRQLLNLAEFHRLDHRMHNKAMIVDNRIAIVGGRNLADEYFGLHTEANFRDMELMVGGPTVSSIAQEFDDYWNDRWTFDIDDISHVKALPADLARARRVAEPTEHIHAEETASERLLEWRSAVAGAFGGKVELHFDEPPETRPDSPEDAPVEVANELVALFDDATESIVIVSAYLIPTPNLEGAIKRAGERGVEVRILTNSIRSNNHLAAHSAYRNHVHTLMNHGAELHEVRVDARDRPRYMLPPTDSKSLALHAKLLIIDDDQVFVGSANLDPRSLRINTEMGLLVTSRPLNRALREQTDPDFSTTNAWRLRFDDEGRVVWVSDTEVRNSQPADSYMQRIEDWLFAHLPIEAEM